ncbi:MAG: DUF2442 domain-containing protein [Solirubrobacterales bacterium]|nr:DUF2442 domain-containing protein [Solirubrobacterales bacterium]
MRLDDCPPHVRSKYARAAEAHGRELFLSFGHFPWFKQATVDAILNLERPAPQHLRWPDLDVDLAVDSIEHPAHYPLKSKL